MAASSPVGTTNLGPRCPTWLRQSWGDGRGGKAEEETPPSIAYIHIGIEINMRPVPRSRSQSLDCQRGCRMLQRWQNQTATGGFGQQRYDVKSMEETPTHHIADEVLVCAKEYERTTNILVKLYKAQELGDSDRHLECSIVAYGFRQCDTGL